MLPDYAEGVTGDEQTNKTVLSRKLHRSHVVGLDQNDGMLRGAGSGNEKTAEEEQLLEDELEEAVVLEILREGRGEREEKGERDEWNQHVGWHRKEDVGARHPREPVSWHNQNEPTGRPRKTTTTSNDRAAAADDEETKARNDNTIEEIVGDNARKKMDLFGGHDLPPPLRKRGFEHPPRGSEMRDFGFHRPHRNGTEPAILFGWKSANALRWVIAATLVFGCVAWWSFRRNPSRLRRFRRRSTKGRTL